MKWLIDALTSSLGRKIIMSLSGLFLISFLIVHLSGNLNLLKDDNGATFNVYSAFMSTNPLIRVLEIGLVVGFALHIYTGIYLLRYNQQARPIQYAISPKSEASWFSKNMGLSGIAVLLFLLLHLKNFYWEYHYGDVSTVTIDGKEYKDMYKITATVFGQWWYTLIYLIAFVLLGFHLNHGFQSAFQTLGLNHVKYNPLIKGLGTILAFVLPAGFAVVAVVMFLKHMA
ncbi:MAG: succinate dehydrogenase cytochrome b subunit [Cytophagales bacterium]|nr:succinate dehydrogenase cytochrome b subunit [Cytophagales bacterium]MDW8384939.1 succinate dehydrogenase cytochrome b subunit [Flammeovirgaceae bacterium]